MCTFVALNFTVMGCRKLNYCVFEQSLQWETPLGKKVVQVWLSVDPMSNQYPNLSNYVYCRNNPIRRVDPNGMFDWEWVANMYHKSAVKKYGEDRVGDVVKNANGKYSFAIMGEGKDKYSHPTEGGVMAYRPDKVVSKWSEYRDYRSGGMVSFFRGELKKSQPFEDKVGNFLNYLGAFTVVEEKDIVNAMQTPMQKVANINPLMYIGHAAAGIESGGKKDAFGNDMNTASWMLMGAGVPFSLFGGMGTSTLVPLGLDITNDVQMMFDKKNNKVKP